MFSTRFALAQPAAGLWSGSMNAPVSPQSSMHQYRAHNVRLISLLLLVLIARALIPPGFMPAGNGAAQLTLCPDGMLMPADTSDAGTAAPHPGSSQVDHCPFGAAPFAAPIAQLAVSPVLATALRLPGFEPSHWVSSTRTARTHQPRAPPA